MDDEDSASEATQEAKERQTDEGDAEYSFEGFKIEFNDRIALTPPPTARPRS
jgi:hypothetical protein